MKLLKKSQGEAVMILRLRHIFFISQLKCLNKYVSLYYSIISLLGHAEQIYENNDDFSVDLDGSSCELVVGVALISSSNFAHFRYNNVAHKPDHQNTDHVIVQEGPVNCNGKTLSNNKSDEYIYQSAAAKYLFFSILFFKLNLHRRHI